MALQLMSSVMLSVAAAALLTVSALYAWSNIRYLPGSRTATLIFLSGAVWAVGCALEQASIGLPTKLFWAKAQYLPMVILPAAWLGLAFQYSGREKWLTRRTLCLLSIVPLTSLLLVFTNDAHSLMWSRIALGTISQRLDKTYSVGFWLLVAAYSYILVLVGTSLLAQVLVRSRRLYGWQAAVLVLAVLAAWLGNALDLLDANPFPQIEPTTVGLAVSGPIVVWTIRRLRAGDIVPVAHEAIVEAMCDGVIVLDERDRIMDMNPAVERFVGRTLKETVGKRVQDVWPGWPSQIERSLLGAEAGREVVLSVEDGQRTYDVRTSNLVDWRGRSTSRVVVLRDITERRRAEEALRESEERFRRILASSPDAITVTDLEGIVIECSQATVDMHGFSAKEELIGKSAFDLIAPRDRPRAAENLEKTLREDAIKNVNYTFLTKDGREFPAELSASVMRDSAGDPTSFVAITTDITERLSAERAGKQAEEAIDRRGEELSALLDAAQALASSLELEGVLETIARKAKELTQADGSMIYLLESDGETLRALVVLSDHAEVIMATPVSVGQGIIGDVAATGRAEIVNHAERDSRDLHIPGTPREAQCLMCAPLPVKGEVIGVMTLSRAGEKEFKEADLRLLTSLASQAATAIENARLYKETRLLAITDPLTGAWNRRNIEDRLQIEAERAHRFHHPLSVLVVDIDKLKLFNDTYGHAAGDEVICKVARSIQASCREIDVVGRYGGDEFAVILPETDAKGAATMARRFSAALDEDPFQAPDGTKVPIRMSVGATSYPLDTGNALRLLSLADAAMYRAKVAGGGQFASIVASPEEVPEDRNRDPGRAAPS